MKTKIYSCYFCPKYCKAKVHIDRDFPAKCLYPLEVPGDDTAEWRFVKEDQED